MIDAELTELACRLAVEAGDQALAGRRAAALEPSTTDRRRSRPPPTSSPSTIGQPKRRSSPASRPLDPTTASSARRAPTAPGTSGVSWLVDPIDGTTNFVYGLAHWATSIAAADADGTLAGAVYVPVLGELFAAGRGRGATLDGRPIRCSDRHELALALVATGFAYVPSTRIEQARVVADLIGAVRDIRRLGSAAIDLCHVACRSRRRLLRSRTQPVGRRCRRADRPRGGLPHGRLRRRAGRPGSSCSPRRRRSSTTSARLLASVSPRFRPRIRHHEGRGNTNPGR